MKLLAQCFEVRGVEVTVKALFRFPALEHDELIGAFGILVEFVKDAAGLGARGDDHRFFEGGDKVSLGAGPDEDFGDNANFGAHVRISKE